MNLVVELRPGFGLNLKARFTKHLKTKNSIYCGEIVITNKSQFHCRMKLKPLSNNLILEAAGEEKITKSGIVLPETAEKEKPTQGKVVAVGDGKLNEKGDRVPMSVKVGDTVLFKKYGPDEIELEGKKYLIAEEGDILAVVEA